MSTVNRAQVIAERDAQIIAWLGRKAVGFGRSNRERRAASDAVALMADKLSRGAVRDDETGLSELYRLRSENGRLLSEARQLQDDVTGACLARYEAEQENARLRLAWRSARERAKAYGEGIVRHVADRKAWKGWEKEAQAELARLREERHSTNGALDDAVRELRMQQARIAELEAERAAVVAALEPRWELPPVTQVRVREALATARPQPPEPAPAERSEDVSPQVARLRGILAGQRAAVDPAVEWRRVEAERPGVDTSHDCGIPLVRRLDCGHCPHEICEDCGHCPHTCRCTAPVISPSPSVGELAEQRHLLDPLDHALEALAPRGVTQ